jgi:hypothetical protein
VKLVASVTKLVASATNFKYILYAKDDDDDDDDDEYKGIKSKKKLFKRFSTFTPIPLHPSKKSTHTHKTNFMQIGTNFK